jgi:hypothetical protein
MRDVRPETRTLLFADDGFPAAVGIVPYRKFAEQVVPVATSYESKSTPFFGAKLSHVKG